MSESPVGIVFDLFHTLVDPEDFRPKEFHRANVIAEILRLDKTSFLAFWESTNRQRMSTPTPEMQYVKDFAAASGRTLSASELAEADSVMGRYQDLAILNPRDEAVAALKLFKGQGYKLGLLSNTYERDVREWDRSPLAKFFDATAFSHEIGVMKPEPDAYKRILGRLGTDPSRCTFVGDGGSQELAGAKEVGFRRVVLMKVFVSKNGLRTKEELEELSMQADFVADSFQGLCKMIT
jgi:putative hydrolase of the HAD superfamily